MGEKKASRFGFYLGLTELADEHRDIIVLDADLPKTTGSEAFRKAHPERFLNVGISEQNMVGMCAGLSRVGYVPFCGSMAVFAAGRAFEIIRNSVAYPSLNVKIVGSHGGITAAGDGGTHQCIEDLAIMRALPNMVVLSPCDSNQAAKLARIAYEHDGPVYVRTSREPTEDITTMDDEIELGKAQKLLDGEDLCIVSTGMMSVIAYEAAKELQVKALGWDLESPRLKTLKNWGYEPCEQSADGDRFRDHTENFLRNAHGSAGWEPLCVAARAEADFHDGRLPAEERSCRRNVCPCGMFF